MIENTILNPTVRLLNLRQPKPDPLSWTLLFKKHKTTVLLMLPSHESIESTKAKLLQSLQDRGIKEINGDVLPEDPAEIEFGVPVDRNELEKGWTLLDMDIEDDTDGTSSKKRPGRSKTEKRDSLQSADIRDGQPIAFRFRKTDQEDDQDELSEDPGWDVVVPTLDDEEPE